MHIQSTQERAIEFLKSSDVINEYINGCDEQNAEKLMQYLTMWNKDHERTFLCHSLMCILAAYMSKPQPIDDIKRFVDVLGNQNMFQYLYTPYDFMSVHVMKAAVRTNDVEYLRVLQPHFNLAKHHQSFFQAVEIQSKVMLEELIPYFNIAEMINNLPDDIHDDEHVAFVVQTQRDMIARHVDDDKPSNKKRVI